MNPPNMLLKSFADRFTLAWQPVTWLACANQAPECLRRLTAGYASEEGFV